MIPANVAHVKGVRMAFCSSRGSGHIQNFCRKSKSEVLLEDEGTLHNYYLGQVEPSPVGGRRRMSQEELVQGRKW